MDTWWNFGHELKKKRFLMRIRVNGPPVRMSMDPPPPSKEETWPALLMATALESPVVYACELWVFAMCPALRGSTVS